MLSLIELSEELKKLPNVKYVAYELFDSGHQLGISVKFEDGTRKAFRTKAVLVDEETLERVKAHIS